MLKQKQNNKLILLGIQKRKATIFFVIEEAKETVLDFSKRTIKLLWFYFVLIQYRFKNDSI